MINKIFLTETLNKLNTISADFLNANTFVGLDGYIDFIQRAVKSQNEEGPEYFATIEDFAQHIGKAAGKSAQIELVTQETKLGGNAPIMAHALGSLGFKTTCIGNFGKESIDHVFQDIHENVELLSVGNSATTNALEFHDGKIILSEVGPFKGLDWEYLKKEAGFETLTSKINLSSLVALVDWCNLPFSTNIWEGILNEIMPSANQSNRHFFFDIADPSRRSDKEIQEALEVIGGYNTFGKVTLGLNENETEKLYSCLNRINQTSEEESISLIEKGNYIYKNINVWNLLIHPTDRAISINNSGVSEITGRFVKHPKISTGGGDNFNAGYCLGQLSGLDIESSMITGIANSGAYVQNGKSSSMTDLKEYLINWIDELT
ncbi:MAG: hypothetical protein KAQ79_23190 [Cyclobacteriaceae bacterium]|nr:hypothetical protein [Cyclobacteriaceae bacterium]